MRRLAQNVFKIIVLKAFRPDYIACPLVPMRAQEDLHPGALQLKGPVSIMV